MTANSLSIQAPRVNFWGRLTNAGKVALDIVRKPVGYTAMALGAATLIDQTCGTAFAQTDMGAAITEVSGYWTTIYPIGVAIVVFIVGRKIVKKL